MINPTMEMMAKKVKALKHCEKVLKKIEANGATKMMLNNTGLTFDVTKGDAIHLRLMSQRALLTEELGTYQIIHAATEFALDKSESLPS